MKKKKKRQNQSRIVDTVIALVFSAGVGYAGVSGLQMIGNKEKSFFDHFVEYDNKFDWLMAQELSYQVPLLVLVVAVFTLMATMTKKKESGYKDASNHGAYGNAVFSDFEDVRESGFIAERKQSKWSKKDPLKTLEVREGIILGMEEDELFIIHPESNLDNRNVLVVGSSGSSKGQAFVINNIINNKSQSIVVTDPKGELYGLTADIKRDQGYQVEQIDFLNLKGSRYNPLDYVDNDIEAIKISNAISINSAKDVKQDFFFNTARDLLTGLIIYAKAEYDSPNISRTVKGIFNRITSDEEYLPQLCERIGEEHTAYQYLKDASAQTGNTRASILSSFAQQTGVFSLGDVAKLTEKSDFSFHDLQEQKTILYVKIPVKDNPVPALTATFFDQLISTLYQIGDENGAVLKIPTIFLLDEFANLGKLNDFDNTLSTCRGYDMSILTIVQDFAQLEGKYSKELSRSIINNHDTTLFLRTKDVETAKYFERLAGDTTVNFSTKSSSNSGGFLYILGFGSSNPSKSTSEQYI
ncbi:MAG: type IV secretory system conjugative DNA transfer family protein, partial [Carnobacterium alterfunditum]